MSFRIRDQAANHVFKFYRPRACRLYLLVVVSLPSVCHLRLPDIDDRCLFQILQFELLHYSNTYFCYRRDLVQSRALSGVITSWGGVTSFWLGFLFSYARHVCNRTFLASFGFPSLAWIGAINELTARILLTTFSGISTSTKVSSRFLFVLWVFGYLMAGLELMM